MIVNGNEQPLLVALESLTLRSLLSLMMLKLYESVYIWGHIAGKIRGRRQRALVSMNATWKQGNGRRECPFLALKTEKGQLISCFELSPCLEYKIQAAQISRLGASAMHMLKLFLY